MNEYDDPWKFIQNLESEVENLKRENRQMRMYLLDAQAQIKEGNIHCKECVNYTRGKVYQGVSGKWDRSDDYCEMFYMFFPPEDFYCGYAEKREE